MEIMLKEKEMTLLIMESINGRAVDYSFGPSGVWIKDTPENKWAIDRINEIRDNTSEGGGI